MPIELAQGTPNSQSKPTAFNLPFYLPEINRVSKFFAREEELTRMQEALQGTDQRRRAVVLHGLGGIGKTQLAIEYAHRHRKDYSTSVWLDARDETAINQSFARLAERILSYDPSVNDISVALKSQNQSNIVAAVKRWLDEPANDSWLIIYDNYDHPNLGNANTEDKDSLLLARRNTFSMDVGRELIPDSFDIRKYLPETDHGAIIITTRVSLKKLGLLIRISKFESLGDGLRILASTSGRDSILKDGAAAELVRRLDGLPLALASAGAYLEQVPMSCTEYLQLYDKSWVELHENTPELESYDKALCSTWNISYTHIKEQSSTASLLLCQWAYFDSKDLWYELLHDGGAYKPEWLRDLTSDKLTFHKIMRLLCSHGLVQADPPSTVQCAESLGYSVHACVHSWMIHVLNRDSDKDMARAAIDCVGSHVPGKEQPEFWSKQRRLLGHADRCYDMINTIHMEDGDLLHSLGFLYADQGRFGEAEVMYKQALQGKEKALGPEHTSTFDTVNHLGNLYANQGRLSEAEVMYERALQGKEKALGPEHTSTLGIVNNLGILYADQGRFSKAEDMYERALQGREKALGPEHASTFDTVNNLGNLYADQGRLSEAEVMYERALQGREKALGPEHISTIRTVHNIGLLYVMQGRFNEAEVIYEQALQGYEKACGPNVIKTYIPALNCLESFGNLCYNQGRLQSARQFYLRAHHGLCAVLGADCKRVRRLSKKLEKIKL